VLPSRHRVCCTIIANHQGEIFIISTAPAALLARVPLRHAFRIAAVVCNATWRLTVARYRRVPAACRLLPSIPYSSRAWAATVSHSHTNTRATSGTGGHKGRHGGKRHGHNCLIGEEGTRLHRYRVLRPPPCAAHLRAFHRFCAPVRAHAHCVHVRGQDINPLKWALCCCVYITPLHALDGPKATMNGDLTLLDISAAAFYLP